MEQPPHVIPKYFENIFYITVFERLTTNYCINVTIDHPHFVNNTDNMIEL